MTPLWQIIVNFALIATGWGSRYCWETVRDMRSFRARERVDREDGRILGALRRTWAETAPRGPETVARAWDPTPGYRGQHRAALEDPEAYQLRTLKDGWRPTQIPVMEVFRT